MTIVRTDFGVLRESARRIRFETTPGLPHTNVQDAIESAVSPAIISTPVDVAMSPYAPLSTDTVLYVDTSGGPVEILMPPAADRVLALSIKDITGNASANNITITPDGAEEIDGLAALTINADFGGYRLNPVTGSGYTVAP